MSGVISKELAGTIAQSAQAGFTGVQAAQSLQQGKALNQISKQRAAVEIANAESAERRAGVAMQNRINQGKRDVATRKVALASRGIVASSNAIRGQIIADTLRDTNLIGEQGDVDRRTFLAQAGMERARGKRARNASEFAAFTALLAGGSAITRDAIKQGLFDEPLEDDPFTINTVS